MGFPNLRRGHSIFPPSWKMKIIRRRKMQRIAVTWNHSTFATTFHRISNFHLFKNTALDMEASEGFSFCTNFSHFSAFQFPNILPFASFTHFKSSFSSHQLMPFHLYIEQHPRQMYKGKFHIQNIYKWNGPRKCCAKNIKK